MMLTCSSSEVMEPRVVRAVLKSAADFTSGSFSSPSVAAMSVHLNQDTIRIRKNQQRSSAARKCQS